MMRSEAPAAMPMGWGASARYVPELHTVARGQLPGSKVSDE